MLGRPAIAVLIPCYNEATTIAKVVGDFRRELPDATVYVYDNNSSDVSAALAQAAGAVVVSEHRQGKGFVVQSMFCDVVADVYVMVDGDDTYPATSVRQLIAPVLAGEADMVVGNRLVEFDEGSYRGLHVFGNHLVVNSINFIFKAKMNDVMSGYRAFNRKLVVNVPVISRGFELETELTLQTLYRNFTITEVPIRYGTRPSGSFSKLSTFRDGARVLLKIVDIFKAYRPLLFFGLIAAVLMLVGLGLGSIPIREYFDTGRIARFPTAILAAALEIVGMVAMSCGIVLDSINHHFRESAQLIRQTMPSKESRWTPSA